MFLYFLEEKAGYEITLYTDIRSFFDQGFGRWGWEFGGGW